MATSKKKKSTSTLPFLIGAIGFGIAAALLSVLFLKAKESALIESLLGEEETTIEVVVANVDLPRGSLVQDGYFAPRDVPAEYVHSDVIYPHEYESFKGRSLTADLAYGKPLLRSFLNEEFPVDFSDTVPLGRRAMTVSVDDINSVAGFIRPGNHIDIFVNIPYADSGFNASLYSVGIYSELPGGVDVSSIGSGNLESLTSQLEPDKVTEILNSLAPGDVIVPVLQGVKVLATGKDPYEESLDLLRQPQYQTDANFTTVTLDVSPDQAALLVAAQDKGDILALLRNRNDESASSFSAISSRDLFQNASKMAAAERARADKVATAAGVDANGKKLLSQEQLAAAGLSVNENGQIVDKDGNIVDPNELIIAADGSVMTKTQLAAAGLSVNASSQIVDKDGNVVSASDVVIAADGSVMTKQQLAAAGLSVNANGEIVDKNGRIVSADELVVSSDGTIITKQQLEAAGISAAAGVDASGNLVDAAGNTLMSQEQLAAAGYSVNENGQIVDKDGNVVDPKDLIVTKDGKVMTKDQFAAAGITIDENGQMVDKNGNVIDADDMVVAADGRVMSKQQLAAAGYSVNEKGEIVDKDGNVVDPKDIVIAADGSVLTAEQLAAAGLSINENGEIVDKDGNVVSPDDIAIASDGSIMNKSELAKAGLSINEKGEVVDANGNVVDKDDLITGPDGTVLSKKQLAAQGYSVNEKGEIVDAQGNVVSAEKVAALAKNQKIRGSSGSESEYEFIIGGASEDGVPKSRVLKTQE